MFEQIWGVSRSVVWILLFNKSWSMRRTCRGVWYAKGMGVGRAWLIREANGLNYLEHEVVGEVRIRGMAGDQRRWEVKKENGFWSWTEGLLSQRWEEMRRDMERVRTGQWDKYGWWQHISQWSKRWMAQSKRNGVCVCVLWRLSPRVSIIVGSVKERSNNWSTALRTPNENETSSICPHGPVISFRPISCVGGQNRWPLKSFLNLRFPNSMPSH